MRRSSAISRFALCLIALLLAHTDLPLPSSTRGGSSERAFVATTCASSTIALPSRSSLEFATAERERLPLPAVAPSDALRIAARSRTSHVAVSAPHARSHTVRHRETPPDESDPH